MIPYLVYPTVLVPIALAFCALRLRQRMHHLDFLAKHLAALLQRNFPIAQGLEALAGDASLGMARRLRRIEASVTAGRPFWTALESERGWFPAPFTAVARAGEESGSLGRLIVPAAASLKAESEFRVHLLGYLAYGTLMLCLITPAVDSLQRWVQPTLLRGALMVPCTPFLGWELSGIIVQSLWAVGSVLGIFWIHLEMVQPHLARIRLLRAASDLAASCTPGIRGLLVRSSAARYAGVLAALLESGLPTVEALDRAAAAESHGGLARRYAVVADAVRRGSSLGEAFRRAGLPEPLPWLVAAAEGGPRVPAALREAAAACEIRVLSTLAVIQRVTFPLIVVLLGIGVGLFAASVFASLAAMIREAMW